MISKFLYLSKINLVKECQLDIGHFAGDEIPPIEKVIYFFLKCVGSGLILIIIFSNNFFLDIFFFTL